jgi:hypothetical protein
MSPDQIAPGLIEEAITTVKMETSKIKTRARLCSTKVKDILDDIDQLEKYLEERKGEPATVDLMNYILSLAPKVRAFVPAIRQIVSSLEQISDKLEELIP